MIRASVILCLLGVVVGVAGCQSAPKDVLVAPRTLTTPYDTSRGEVLWAVIPLRNESGTNTGDLLGLSDSLVAAAEQVQGVRCVPLNRTLAAMQALKMNEVRTPADARKLSEAMGVDAVLVGTVTAYDPYTPVIGMTCGLYARPGAMAMGRSTVDPRAVAASSVDITPPSSSWRDDPVVVVSEYLDSKNNQVLMDLKTYADGRMNKVSALGWRRYTSSVALFGEFAAYRMVDEIMKKEWVRVGSGVGSGQEEALMESMGR